MKFKLQITRNLLNQLKEDYRIWVHVKIQTMSGLWGNAIITVDLSPYGATTHKDGVTDIVIDIDTKDIRLWDARRYMQDPAYADGIIGAPTLVVQIFDADPSRYFIDTGERFFSPINSATLQTISCPTLLQFIDDRQAQYEFFAAHLLDSQFIGMNMKNDRLYLDRCKAKRDAYWASLQAKSQDPTAVTITVIFNVGIILLSVAELVWTKGGSAAESMAGIIFALDQLQALYTGRSVFSVAFSFIVVPIMGLIYSSQGKPWTSEQWSEAYRAFNIWSPFSFKTSAPYRIANGVWVALFSYALYRGLIKFGNSLFEIVQSPVRTFEVSYRLGRISAEEYATDLRAELLRTGQFPLLQEISDLAKVLRNPYLPAFKTATNALTEATRIIMRQAGLWQSMPLWYRILYCTKAFVGGLISPSEWAEGLYFLKTGVMFTINNGFVSWLWNFGDNIYLAVFDQDTTYGMIKAISGALKGDWSHFAIWPGTLDIQEFVRNTLPFFILAPFILFS